MIDKRGFFDKMIIHRLTLVLTYKIGIIKKKDKNEEI